MSQIGNLISGARKAKGLSPTDLVRAAGYRNLDKGRRRLRAIEGGTNSLPDMRILQRFAKTLALDETAVGGALSADWADLSRPIQPRLLVRIMPAIYEEKSLPVGCSPGEALEIARRIAAQRRLQVCVRLSRVRCVYIEPSGKAVLSCSPPRTNLSLASGLRGIPGQSFCPDTRRVR